VGLPDHISSERTYEARITEVYKTVQPGQPGNPGQSGATGDDNSFTYDAEAVDTTDVVRVTRIAPFRRFISSNLQPRPQIVAASVGDPCRIDMHGQTPRLIDVLEQYIVEDCAGSDSTNPTPDPITPPPFQIDPTPIIPVSPS